MGQLLIHEYAATYDDPRLDAAVPDRHLANATPLVVGEQCANATNASLRDLENLEKLIELRLGYSDGFSHR